MPPGSPALVERLRALDVARMVRYGAVSAISFPFTQVLLLVCTVGFEWSGAVSNVVAVTVASGPAYVLNRYWVWGKKDRNSLTQEILPFWGITLVGLGLSTFFAWYADRTFEAEYWINVANALGFGLVWVFKYLLLDRMMFGRAVAASDGGNEDADDGGPPVAEPTARA